MTGTKWTQIYRYNYAIYMIFAIINCMGICCVPCAPGLICTGCCFCMTGIPTLTAIILTGIRLKNETGIKCSENDAIYDVDNDLSFQTDATKLYTLWIWQMALHVPFGVCTALGGVLSIFTFDKFKRGSDDFYD